jgi:hypothetical protein
VAARNKLLLDLVLRSAEILLGVKNLLLSGDIVGIAGEQIDGACDVLQVQTTAEADECPLGETVFLEQLPDDLQVPTPWQVDRVFVSAGESFFLGHIGRIIDVLVEIDLVLKIMLFGMHVLPPLQHEFPLHQAVTKRNQFLVE